MAYRRSVLMGDPAQFRILGGANPHTRNRWGMRKSVDRPRAVAQWHGLARLLSDLGVEIYVLPAVPSSPGMVYPANAGIVAPPLDEVPLAQKAFVLSESIPTRAAEKEAYSLFLRGLGFRVRPFAKRFEGEADFFPAAGIFLFTSGVVTRQRFVFRPGWPPYKRVYGFRSVPSAADDLKDYAGGREILPLTLVRETHYHGDTCLCAFGRAREFLMVYEPALSESSRARLREKFGANLVELSEEDGELFSANSFQVDGPAPVLVMPHTASARLRAQVEERGVRTVTADVSEFMQKGGGSVKCLIGDLGPLDADGADVSSGARDFRQANRYRTLFPLL